MICIKIIVDLIYFICYNLSRLTINALKLKPQKQNYLEIELKKKVICVDKEFMKNTHQSKLVRIYKN